MRWKSESRPRHALTLLTAALLALANLPDAAAEDVLIRNRPAGGVEGRQEYSDMVLDEAMRRTTKKYGPYRIEGVVSTASRERLLLQMIAGEELNTSVKPSQPSWEEALLPIWIPVDMGLSNFRIALTHRNAQARISALRTLDQLKALPMGIGASWSSRKVMEANGFNLVPAEGFESLLKMLMAERFDIFPRAMNEVFVEFDERSAATPELAIERDIVIEFPLPSYVFVSPKAPRLHRRLSEGIESMVRDGSLLKLVTNYHADMIRRTNFCARRIFHIENSFVSEKTPLKRKEVWFDPYDPKTGICKTQGKPAAKPRH